MIKTISHKQFAVELDLLNRAIQGSVDQALMLESMVSMAKVFCPVDTGALQGSIRAERREPYTAMLVAGGADYIHPKTGKSVDYAVHVHEGTSRMPARPFLTQAVQREKLPWARKVLTETLERI